MLNVEFSGADRLVEGLDAAVTAATPQEIAGGVKDCLCRLLSEAALDLPTAVQMPGAESYGRHLLYRSDDHGYVIVAMAWGPGQGTPVHDHAGIWCVEGVWKGELEVVQYDLEESDGSRCRFQRHETVIAGPGSAGALIPPFEYHTLTNSLPGETTITLHIYGRDLEECSIFVPLSDGWYERQTRTLSYAH